MNRKPISRIVADLAVAAPDRPAVTCGDETVTRMELERRANRLARAYEELGVQQGSFVSLCLPNSVEFYVATVATWKLGAVPQPVSHRLPARELDAIVHLANPALVVGVDPADYPGRACIPAGFEPSAAISDAPLEARVSPYWKAPTSGGSTGRPKLIVSTLSGDLPEDLGAAYGMVRDECQLVPGPLYHNAPFSLSHAGLFMGHHLVVLPRFDAEAALEAIARHRVTWTNLVPTMMLRMARLLEASPERFDLSSLRMVWHMAAPCPEWLKEKWIGLVGPERLWELYGGTESQAIATISGTEWLVHRGSVGRPVQGEMTVLDEHGNPAPPGQEGEIYLRSGPDGAPTYFYVGAERRMHGSWESLGDLGWMDEDGYLYISDRRTDLILRGGANVYPAEVEAAILEHPSVLSCAVVGLPDDELGQRVHAVVEARDGLDEDSLRRHLAERLVSYKLPSSVEFTSQPVRDDAGKVRRRALQEDAVHRSVPRRTAP